MNSEKLKQSIILEKPFAGWSSITLKDEEGNSFTGGLSYIDSVPEVFLGAFENEEIYNNCNPMTFTFDEEGSEFYLIVCDYYTLCIEDASEFSVTRVWINKNDFIVAICNQLIENIDDWAIWDIFADSQEEIDRIGEENKLLLVPRIGSILTTFEGKRL